MLQRYKDKRVCAVCYEEFAGGAPHCEKRDCRELHASRKWRQEFDLELLKTNCNVIRLRRRARGVPKPAAI